MQIYNIYVLLLSLVELVHNLLGGFINITLSKVYEVFIIYLHMIIHASICICVKRQ